MDSTGLRWLFDTYLDLVVAHREMPLIVPEDSHIERLLSIVGAEQVFLIYRNLEKALGRISASEISPVLDGRTTPSSAHLMDEHLRLIFREEFHLDDLTPRAVRQRIASFEPLLGDATSSMQLAASEVSTAFARERQPDSSMELRLLGVDLLFRVEISDSLEEQYLLLTKDGRETFRRQVLDDTTDRWGLIGNGSAVVWFEKSRSAAPAEKVS